MKQLTKKGEKQMKKSGLDKNPKGVNDKEAPRKIVLSEQPGDPTPKPVPKTMSATDFLNTMGVKVDEPKKTKKNGIQTLTPNESIQKAVDDVVKWKKIEKEAEAERLSKEVEIIDFVQIKQDEDGLHNNYQKSYYVTGQKERVTFVSADKFYPKADDIPALKEALGDRFGEFVEQKIEFAVKSEVIADPVALTELRKLVGDENFFRFFEPKTRYVAAEGFDRKRYTLDKDTLAKVKELVPQAKPAIK
jgi:hypothetical protein